MPPSTAAIAAISGLGYTGILEQNTTADGQTETTYDDGRVVVKFADVKRQAMATARDVHPGLFP